MKFAWLFLLIAVLLPAIALWYRVRWILIEIGVLRKIERSVAVSYFNHLSIFFLSAYFLYVIVALVFSGYYALAEKLEPGQHFIGCERGCVWTDFIYFSVITIATVGYGDIRPKSPHMRMVASFEVLVGLLFIGVLISLLASFGPMYVVESTEKVQALINRLKSWRGKQSAD